LFLRGHCNLLQKSIVWEYLLLISLSFMWYLNEMFFKYSKVALLYYISSDSNFHTVEYIKAEFALLKTFLLCYVW